MITGQKQVEKQHTHAGSEDPSRDKAHFALAERAAGFGYWRWEIATGAVYWSPGMFALLDVNPNEQEADSEWLLDQIEPADREMVEKTIDRAVATKSPFNYRTHARYPRFAAQIVDTYGEVEIDKNGEAVAVLGVCRDVTAQVAAERAREQAERRYRLMAQETSDIIVLSTPNGKIQFASSALQRVLGRGIEEIELGRYIDLVHPEDREEAERHGNTIPTGEAITVTYRVRHKDGHYLWIESTTRGIYDETTGQLRSLITSSRDVTARKEQELAMRAAREHAEAANKAKSTFLANMSHELRTPLNAIIGFADIMRQEMFGPHVSVRYGEYTTLIYDSGQLLLDLISDMLDMAKIEAGKLDLNYERCDLQGTIEDCLRMLQERADANGIELSVVEPKGDLTLIADRRALKQMLLNLLTNAVKFTPAGGHVVVTARAENGAIRVNIRDDGIGISAEDLPRLGRPFEQVCGDPRLAKGGTGLGLALVGALVEKHGGRLRIESEEGVGTEAIVELPAQPRARAVA